MEERKKSNQKNIVKKIVIYVSAIFIFAAVCILTWIYCPGVRIDFCGLLKEINDSIGESLSGVILDAFNLVWGTTIAVTIFVLEVGGEYKYGVTLRRMAVLKLGGRVIKRGAFSYIMLCPVVYIAHAIQCFVIVIIVTAISLLGLVVVLYNTVNMTRGRSIRQILKDSTIKGIETIITNISLDDVHKIEEEKSIQSMIESLPITDMLEHIDYSNAEETRSLIDVLVKCNMKFAEETLRTYAGNTLLYAWVSRIVTKSDLSAEYGRDRLVNLLRDLWQSINKDIKLSQYRPSINERLALSCAMQILLPLIDSNEDNSSNVLSRVWERMTDYNSQILPYLLLYTEFRYWMVDGQENNWFANTDYNMRIELERIKKGNIRLDRKFAQDCWIDWSQYSQIRSGIDLRCCDVFCQDIVRLKAGCWDKIESKVIGKLLRGRKAR